MLISLPYPDCGISCLGFGFGTSRLSISVFRSGIVDRCLSRVVTFRSLPFQPCASISSRYFNQMLSKSALLASMVDIGGILWFKSVDQFHDSRNRGFGSRNISVIFTTSIRLLAHRPLHIRGLSSKSVAGYLLCSWTRSVLQRDCCSKDLVQWLSRIVRSILSMLTKIARLLAAFAQTGQAVKHQCAPR